MLIRSVGLGLMALVLAGCQTTESGSRHDQAALAAAQREYVSSGGFAAGRATRVQGDPLTKADAVLAFCEPKVGPVRAAMAGESAAYREGYIGAMKKDLRSRVVGTLLGV